MRRYDRLAIAVFGTSCLLAAGLLFAGCERIPDHIMNSPPAVNGRFDVEEPIRNEADSPETQTPPAAIPRPQDKVASYESNSIPDDDDDSIDDQLAAEATSALARIGAAVVPSLVLELNSEEPLQRERAAVALSRIGPAAIEAAEPLVERLEDEQEQRSVQLACAKALKEMGPALWPAEPQPRLPRPSLEPLPELGEEDAENPQLAVLAQRRETMRIEYEERSERQQQEYYHQLQEYERRVAIAQRAVDALKKLALPNNS